jgi:hypothetical protein
MLEEFRELVRAGILRVTPENEVLPVKDRPEKGSEKLAPPSSREDEVALLDKQLIEWLERRREKKGEESRRQSPAASEAITSGIRDKVIERVAQKVMETWDQSSLRDQIVDRIAEDIYRRLQRTLE